MEVGPQYRAIDSIGCLQHMMVISPVSTEKDEAEDVRTKGWRGRALAWISGVEIVQE